MAPQFSLLLSLPERAPEGILFSAICSAPVADNRCVGGTTTINHGLKDFVDRFAQSIRGRLVELNAMSEMVDRPYVGCHLKKSNAAKIKVYRDWLKERRS